MKLCMFVSGMLLALSASACVETRSVYIVITSTAEPAAISAPTETLLFPAPIFTASPVAEITATPVPVSQEQSGRQYVVRPGDTLSSIAVQYGVTLEALISTNGISNPNIISPGQIIVLPELPASTTPDFVILPDNAVVRGPGSREFDVDGFVADQPGYIRSVVEDVFGQMLTGAQIVERVSLEFSVDARLLLALLEHRANWLTEPEPSETLRAYPLGAPASPLGFDRNGLYRQLAWAADRINQGYYGWKYGGLQTVEFETGERMTFAASVNAGTVGLQYMLAQYSTSEHWLLEIGPTGLRRTYESFTGDAFASALDRLVPADIAQPEMRLPFAEGEVWFFTGGPHGGWGSGSAWSAIDFAPPDDLTTVSSSCYVSEHWVTAVADGVITYSENGIVILDLDGDGDDSTGWSVLYLHLASQGRITAGAQVSAGDPIGRPSCEGGVSTGTHIHIARRYNGEWIPADCSSCPSTITAPPFVLSGWRIFGLVGQEYQGYMTRDGERRIAEQGRLTTDNLVSH